MAASVPHFALSVVSLDGATITIADAEPTGPDTGILEFSDSTPDSALWLDGMMETYSASDDTWYPAYVAVIHPDYIEVSRGGGDDWSDGTPWRVLSAPPAFIVPAFGVMVG